VNLASVEIKAFVPTRDMEQSIAFYKDLGFDVPSNSDGVAYVRHGDCSFLLQQFYVPEHANNFMMHLLVEDVDDWYRHVLATGVAEKYGIRIEPPADRPWAMRDFPMLDPSGVLWRIGQNLPKG
jgi:catechol 2,3-dioxygenase-like lactoylglutathione lyase family enzyme